MRERVLFTGERMQKEARALCVSLGEAQGLKVPFLKCNRILFRHCFDAIDSLCWKHNSAINRRTNTTKSKGMIQV